MPEKCQAGGVAVTPQAYERMFKESQPAIGRPSPKTDRLDPKEGALRPEAFRQVYEGKTDPADLPVTLEKIENRRGDTDYYTAKAKDGNEQHYLRVVLGDDPDCGVVYRKTYNPTQIRPATPQEMAKLEKLMASPTTKEIEQPERAQYQTEGRRRFTIAVPAQ